MRYYSNYDTPKQYQGQLNIIGRIVILLIPVINVAAALIWGFTSENPQVRKLGKGALGVFTIMVFAAVIYGLTGLSGVIDLIEDLQ